MSYNPETFLQTFSELSKKPHEFLSVQSETAEKVKGFLKQLYDFTKCNEDQKYKNTLPKLIVEKFDEEQIWQELELQNTIISNDLVQNISQFSVKKDKLKFPVKLKCNKDAETKASPPLSKEEFDELEDFGSESEHLENEEEEDDEDVEDESATSGDDSDNGKDRILKKGNVKPSIVDDQFFKLNELEQFLQNEEKNIDKPAKEHRTIDLFDNTDDEVADYKYSDFFEDPDEEAHSSTKVKKHKSKADDELDDVDLSDEDQDIDEDFDEVDEHQSREEMQRKRKMDEAEDNHNESDEDKQDEKPNSKKVRFNLLGSGDESDLEPENGRSKKSKKSDEVKSSLEQRQERLSKLIGRLEEEAVSEKPWQLKGEVAANLRPENSLLEEAVDFDLSVRPAPVMTGEVTMKLEDIIMQRIKDKAWDDVERKVKPVDTPAEFKKKLALDQEKSKLSLAEVYEKEFIKQREAATTDDTERQEVEPALHVEVRGMLSSLFNKLDALSNYHYTPRPVVPEMKVVSNVAAINMEEVAPISVADSALLAPQEIKGKKRAIQLMSKEERTETDKKRARRLKKTKQRQRQREKEKAAKDISKLNPGLGNKYSKLKMEKQLMDVSSNNVIKMDEKQDKVIKGSTSFFNKLQDEVKSQIKSKTSPFAKKKDKRLITAKKLKL